MSMKNIELGDNRLAFALVLMALAYAFSIGIRMIWVYQMGGMDVYHWNGELMINTNDGYYFAAAAQKALEGIHLSNPRLPDWTDSGVVFVTVLLAKLTPFSLDTIILYLPAIISGLVVIPIILIGRLYGSSLFGFFAALIGSIAWSYYNRTMTGYYDTDMFSAMMPMFILYFLLATMETEKRIFMLLSALSILIYPFLYDSGLSLIYAMGMLYMGYMVIFHRNDRFTYESTVLIAVALMGMDVWVKLALIIALFILFARLEFERQKLIIAAAVAVLVFMYSGNVFSIIWAKFSVYFFRGVDQSGGLMFFEVAQTVREASRIPFETMANRISGSVPGVLAALIGYVLLVIRHRGFILALPLIGIGIFSLWGGLRFTVYAVPVAAISVVYLFYVIGTLVNFWARLGIIAALTGAMLYPNITHIEEYRVPTVFNKSEVEVLDKLSKVGTEDDYVLTWWDYGYPVWYYAGKNTLIDGGKHNHDNFIISEILSSASQNEAARLGRLAVETYVDQNYSIVADKLFRNKQPDQRDVSDYLETLRYGEVALPEKTREIYLMLPFRMMDIFPTVQRFSALDLNSGQKYKQPFFFVSSQFEDTKEMILLGRGIALNKRTGSIMMGEKEMPLQASYTVITKPDGSVQTHRQLISMRGSLSLIYLGSYRRFLLVDNEAFNSNFVQMFVFDNYDKTLFEPVIASPLIKIYRFKI